jgi:hypothetical protein
VPQYTWIRSTGEHSDLSTDEFLRIRDVLPGTPPEVTASVENGVLRTRLANRRLVELELRSAQGSNDDEIGLIEPDDGQELAVGDVLTYRYE